MSPKKKKKTMKNVFEGYLMDANILTEEEIKQKEEQKLHEKENKKKKNPFVIALVLFISLLPLLIVLYVAVSYGPNLGIYILPQSPKQYVNQAVELMDLQGIYADTEEWKAMKESTLEKAKTLTSFEEAHVLVNEALKVAGGKQSKLVTLQEGYVQGAKYPEITELAEGIIMISLPEFTGNEVEAQHYADVSVAAIEGAIRDAKGIIIDLRDNRGGNMGPMIGAIAPLIPDGEVVKFDIKGFSRGVTLSEGMVNGGGTTVKVKSFKLMNLPVAVLQNEKTASAGETTVLAFRGLENVKTFGADTAGDCGSNTTRKMYDHAQLQLTIGRNVTRTDEVFCEDPIAPDFYSEYPIQDALDWIQSYK